jgi:hypothetical protein
MFLKNIFTGIGKRLKILGERRKVFTFRSIPMEKSRATFYTHKYFLTIAVSKISSFTSQK